MPIGSKNGMASKSLVELDLFLKRTAKQLRGDQLSFGHFTVSVGMLMSVWQASLLEIKHLTAVELGVSNGRGLLAMVETADYIREHTDVDIEVCGFDIVTGMPEPQGFRDHPEIWQKGEFPCEYTTLEEKIKDRTTLYIGDVAQTVPEFAKQFAGTLGYISLDLDYYSSSMSCFPLFEMAPERYLPAVPMHVDDVNTNFMFNPWCGEACAIETFNKGHRTRKIHEKHALYQTPNLHALHVLDHPYCTGEKTPPNALNLGPLL